MNELWSNGRDMPLFLAPMAGITDWVFRLLCEEQGADIATTEMISAQGRPPGRFPPPVVLPGST